MELEHCRELVVQRLRVVEGKQDYRNGKNKGQDPTPFKLYAVKIP